jgi:DNA repair protein RecN (Recombination protein N)
VVCITHLPQVASLAARHFRVSKQVPLRDAAEAAVAQAEVHRLGRTELVEELCRMLGADEGDEAARQHAENMLPAA